jgi:hypothetical protein
MDPAPGWVEALLETFITVSSELQEIRDLLRVISRKLDVIAEEREAAALAALSEVALGGFLEAEPDIYSIEDVKVR